MVYKLQNVANNCKHPIGHPRIRRELQRYRVVRKRLFRDELIGRYTRPIFKFFDISGDNSISKTEYVSMFRLTLR